jgi:hypothetical protein
MLGPFLDGKCERTYLIDGAPTGDIAEATAQQEITVSITVPVVDVDIMPMVPFTILDPNPFVLKGEITLSKEGTDFE